MMVFISYGSATDQVTALRLQALAAVNGLTAFVPPAHTRRSGAAGMDPEVRNKLAAADVVLGLAGAALTEPCRQELNHGIALRKNTIVMAGPAPFAHLRQTTGIQLILIDPEEPEAAEKAIVQYWKALEASQSDRQALLALGTIALGLLLFPPAELA